MDSGGAGGSRWLDTGCCVLGCKEFRGHTASILNGCLCNRGARGVGVVTIPSRITPTHALLETISHYSSYFVTSVPLLQLVVITTWLLMAKKATRIFVTCENACIVQVPFKTQGLFHFTCLNTM